MPLGSHINAIRAIKTFFLTMHGFWIFLNTVLIFFYNILLYYPIYKAVKVRIYMYMHWASIVWCPKHVSTMLEGRQIWLCFFFIWPSKTMVLSTFIARLTLQISLQRCLTTSKSFQVCQHKLTTNFHGRSQLICASF